MPFRQTTVFVESFLRLAGLDWKSAQLASPQAMSAMLPDLLEQIPLEQKVAIITADGVYVTRRWRAVIAARGAPAIVSQLRNALLWKPTTAGAIARNEAVRAFKDLGRALWKKITEYHRRSRAETKMNCVKLFGQGLMARNFDRRVAEL